MGLGRMTGYSGGASRVRGPIRLTGSLNDLACGFVLPALSLERGIVMTRAVEIG